MFDFLNFYFIEWKGTDNNYDNCRWHSFSVLGATFLLEDSNSKANGNNHYNHALIYFI